MLPVSSTANRPRNHRGNTEEETMTSSSLDRSIAKSNGGPVTRRRFLSLTAGSAVASAVALPLLLEACGAAAPAAGPQAAPQSAGSQAAAGVKLSSPFPTYIPFVSPAKPDFHDPDPRYDDGYDTIPTPFKSWTKAPPGTGSTVNVLIAAYYPPPSPRDQNPTWQAVEKQLNATVPMNITPAADYRTKLAVIMAGNDLPDIMHLPFGYTAAANLPDFFKASCADLTPYLAGNAVKEYPNLAAIPTYAWKNSVSAIDGKLYLIPIQRYIPGGSPQYGFFFRNNAMWDKAIGADTLPKNAQDFKKMLQQLNNPKGNVYAIENIANYIYGLPAYLPMFGAPNNWRLDPSGKLIKDWETEEYKAALSYLRDLYASGLFSPAAVDSSTNSRNDFVAGKMAVAVDGYGNSWNDFWRRGLQAQPPNTYSFTPPFAADGGKPMTYESGGFVSMNMLKKGSPDRIKEVLRIIDWLAAPFASEEDILLSYGLKDQDYSLDAKGNPVPTSKGNLNAGYVPWRYIVQHTQVSYQPDLPGYAKASFDAEKLILPVAVKDPTMGYYSGTLYDKGFPANTTFTTGINQIIIGNQPFTTLDQLIKTWQTQAGDQIRKEYMDAIAAAK